MKLVNRNTRPVWYALYESDTDVTTTDEWGNELLTGEHKVSYSEPSVVKASVSPSSGEAQEDMFGTNISYSKVIIVADPRCPIDENSILWLDAEPQFDEEGNPVFEYTIAAVARSLNYTSYAVRKREVS